MEEDYVVFDNEKIKYIVNRKQIKNINMRINPDGNIVISAPEKVKAKEIRRLVLDKVGWIKKTQISLSKIDRKRENLNFLDGEKIYLLGKEYILKIIPSKLNSMHIQDNTLYINIKKNNKEYIQNFYMKFLKQNLKCKVSQFVEYYCDTLVAHDILAPNIEIRKMKSRWGTCIPKKNKVIFNMALIKTPEHCIEYVVLHELTHFKHINHNEKFYNFITVFMPDWKRRKKILDEEYAGII